MRPSVKVPTILFGGYRRGEVDFDFCGGKAGLTPLRFEVFTLRHAPAALDRMKNQW